MSDKEDDQVRVVVVRTNKLSRQARWRRGVGRGECACGPQSATARMAPFSASLPCDCVRAWSQGGEEEQQEKERAEKSGSDDGGGGDGGGDGGGNDDKDGDKEYKDADVFGPPPLRRAVLVRALARLVVVLPGPRSGV